MRLEFTSVAAAFVVSIAALNGPVGAAPFTNGSFETPSLNPSPGLVFLQNGNTSLTGWTVGGADVVHGNSSQTYWMPASQGTQLVVLNNDSPSLMGGLSSIYQTFDTTTGTTYQVRFDMSREAVGTGGATPSFSVTATGNAASIYTAIDTPTWLTQVYNFTAIGPSTTLTFSRTALAGQSASPVIDNVRVTAQAVPEPASFALWSLLSMGTFLGFSRCRRCFSRA